jgi:hypothetical protein
MTSRRAGGHDDDHLPEQFLVDGVAPSVIGDGPPESPFDVAPDPGPPGRHQRQANGPTPRRPLADQRQEPPTAPIPALQPQDEKRKSWLGRMFRG